MFTLTKVIIGVIPFSSMHYAGPETAIPSGNQEEVTPAMNPYGM